MRPGDAHPAGVRRTAVARRSSDRDLAGRVVHLVVRLRTGGRRTGTRGHRRATDRTTEPGKLSGRALERAGRSVPVAAEPRVRERRLVAEITRLAQVLDPTGELVGRLRRHRHRLTGTAVRRELVREPAELIRSLGTPGLGAQLLGTRSALGTGATLETGATVAAEAALSTGTAESTFDRPAESTLAAGYSGTALDGRPTEGARTVRATGAVRATGTATSAEFLDQSATTGVVPAAVTGAKLTRTGFAGTGLAGTGLAGTGLAGT
ncbi:hypothetical protein ACFF2X_41730, partial [Cryptosporangium minutisporangium]